MAERTDRPSFYTAHDQATRRFFAPSAPVDPAAFRSELVAAAGSRGSATSSGGGGGGLGATCNRGLACMQSN
jgi:hypothetical protein